MRPRLKWLFSAMAPCLLLPCIVLAAAQGTYHYDVNGRLESVDYGNGKVIVFSYDLNGNIVSRHENTPPNLPTSGGSNVGQGYVNLIWTGGDPNNDEVTYHIWLDKNPNPTTDITPSGTTSVSFHLTGAECGTTYYWKVIASVHPETQV